MHLNKYGDRKLVGDRMKKREIDLREGTLILRLHDLKRRSATLFKADLEEGRLYVKKKGKKLEILHEINRVPTNVEVDLSQVDIDEIEELAITWNVFTRKFCLYLNGEKLAETELSYWESPSYIA